MTPSIIQVDAFTDRPFAGNPAAVCVLSEARDEEWMQSVAREMNLSETAFLLPEGDAWNLRWFTPTVEVELCGHATLSAAHVLWEIEALRADQPAVFTTLSGTLTAAQEGDWIVMDFPATPAEAIIAPAGLEEALGASARSFGRTRFDYLVELESAQAVREARPRFGLLRRFDVRGVMITATSDDPAYDFVSRFFAPVSGVDEDPVTGSAHCALGPFWAERLERQELTGYQASERGGVVRVRTLGDRVELRGQAVTVLRAELLF